MARVTDQLSSLWPALAFLLAGVPLAALLDQLGFFQATAEAFAGRKGRNTSVLGLWILAALTTVVLNLDTTVVLLTPLYIRVARRVNTDPATLAVIPLLLASLASSVLPVSNLTTLIVASRLNLQTAAVLAHLALPSFVAVIVGWFAYSRRYPTHLTNAPADTPNQRALITGGLIVGALLIGFVVGPSYGIQPWMSAALADLVLIGITRTVPWRKLPLITAACVAIIAAFVALIIPSDALTTTLRHTNPSALIGISIGAAGVANVINNLPALLIALDGVHRMSWGMWAWLLGVNTGAVFLPIGALANLLWLRIMRAEGLQISFRRYIKITIPIALPAFIAALATLALERVLFA